MDEAELGGLTLDEATVEQIADYWRARGLSFLVLVESVEPGAKPGEAKAKMFVNTKSPQAALVMAKGLEGLIRSQARQEEQQGEDES